MPANPDKSHYDESRAIRLIRDRILSYAPRFETDTVAVRGQATKDSGCPSNPAGAVPLWHIFGFSRNPSDKPAEFFRRVVPSYKDASTVDVFRSLLCDLAVVFTKGDYATVHGHTVNGCYRRDVSGADVIQKFGTRAIIVLPLGEIADNTTVASSTTSHELRHAWDEAQQHWSMSSSYTSPDKNPELYFKNPAEIRARVTEIAHQAEDVIHQLVGAALGRDAEANRDGSIAVLTDIFGSGTAVFSSWLFGLLTPFHLSAGDQGEATKLPPPTLDRHLLQTLLKITAGAYAPKMSRKVSREEQQRVQDWMASYSSSLYKELVSMYKTKLPSAVFHNNEDKTRQLWSEAHRNLEQLKAELPNLSW
jgi:hypothetical protein